MKNIEQLLKDSLDHSLNQKNGRTPPHLEESIRYSLLAPGRRIRPRLLLACAKMIDLAPEIAQPAAIALEMLHCFTLIHDDLPCMDNDDFRRGLPSNHKKFGESLALLAGDSLLALAVDIFLDSPVESTALRSGLKRFIWAAGPRGVMGGQAMESLLGKNSTLDDLRQMHYQKTGALFSAALLIPKDLSGIADDSKPGRALEQFSYELGIAFQIADDLEDLLQEGIDPAEGNPAMTFSHLGLQSGVYPPTNILYYLSAAEATQMTLAKLNAVSENLIRIWDSKADELLELSHEVLEKIETAQKGFAS